MGPHESRWLLLFVYRKNVDIDIEKRCPHLISVFVPLACLTLLKSLVCAYLLPVSITVFDWSLLYEKLQSARGERASYGPPQGQGKALASTGRQAQHIWRLKVTSSPCRHPSAHALECVSFTKYSVCWDPVNAWLFSFWCTLKDSAGWLCKDMSTLMSTFHVNLDAMHIY